MTNLLKKILLGSVALAFVSAGVTTADAGQCKTQCGAKPSKKKDRANYDRYKQCMQQCKQNKRSGGHNSMTPQHPGQPMHGGEQSQESMHEGSTQ